MIGEGVHNSYKEDAKKGGDVLWKVKIKGQKELAPGIPLHMSLKVFDDKKDMNLREIKQKIKEHGISTPDPEKLRYKTTIFTSERDGKKHFMLIISGTDKAYEDFYDAMKHCGTVYKKFMPHVTIDKGLYDRINEEGLKPEEVEFENLSIEHGAGNTIYEFQKSEKYLTLVKETISMNVDLKAFEKALHLDNQTLLNFMQDNPGLEQKILEKHEDRIHHHFGHNAEAVTFAWKHGIEETYDFLKRK